MMLFCESCERGIEIPKHAAEVTCSCGARYRVDQAKPDYWRIPRQKTIAVDFDGTICEDRYPECGPVIPEAANILREFHAVGGTIIIWTCRVEVDLDNALEFLRREKIPFDAVNCQVDGACEAFRSKFPHIVNPDCRKVAADMYIDDRNPGGVDWGYVGRLLLGDAHG